jgi:predicted DsbA family dithiol-disulfide isomerase
VLRRARTIAAVAALGAAAALGGCAGTKAGPLGGSGGAASGPDEIEKRNYEAVLDDALCPCGAAHTLRTCLTSHGDCASRVAAGKMARRLVSDGLPRTEIVESITKRFAAKAMAVNVKDAPCKGAAAETAKVTIVEFADFECPHCKAAVELWKPLLERFPAALRVCFKNYPLASHPNAEIAARAAIVAGRAGKFWEMHDLIFEHQTELSVDMLLTLARSLGFEDDPFLTEMTAETTRARVAADKDDGDLVGVISTPTLFVNGIKFTERRRVDVLAAWIEDALAAHP